MDRSSCNLLLPTNSDGEEEEEEKTWEPNKLPQAQLLPLAQFISTKRVGTDYLELTPIDVP